MRFIVISLFFVVFNFECSHGSQGLQGIKSSQGSLVSRNYNFAKVIQGINKGFKNSKDTQSIQGFKVSKNIQSIHVYQNLQGYKDLQRSHSSKGSHGIQNSQPSQSFQNDQHSKVSRNIQTSLSSRDPPSLHLSKGIHGSQSYRGSKEPQSFQSLQDSKSSYGSQIFQGLHGYQNSVDSQDLKNSFISKGSQYEQSFQESQNSHSSHDLRRFQGPRDSQSFQGVYGYKGPQTFQSSQDSQGSQEAQTPIKNVCKEFSDYNCIKSEDCWFNPDAESRTGDIIERHGYPLEQYEAVTDDSYILTVFRIPPRNQTAKGVVFLQHPALSSSSLWVARGNKSFAFLLADAGYDVWMGNFRTTSYSDKHKSISKEKNPDAYWDYSFHEYGIYDLPAQIGVIRENTGYKQKLIYIGHSVATTAALIYSSLKPSEADDNVQLFILWSPIAFLGHLKTPIRYLAPITGLVEFNLNLFNARGITYNGTVHRFIKKMCLSTPSLLGTCSNMIDNVVGPQNQGGNPPELPVLIYQSFEGISVKTLAHFGQLVNSKNRFAKFDYGLVMNLVRYLSLRPPEYPLKKIKVPMHLVYGENDYFSTEKDVQLLYDRLPEDIRIGFERIDSFSHFDFHYGKQVKELLHEPTVKYIDQFVSTAGGNKGQ